MRGWPLREWLIVWVVGLLLAYPLVRLTSSVPSAPRPAESVPDDAHAPVTAWGELRFSHAPERFVLFFGDRELARGGGDLRDEFEALLALDHGHATFRLDLVWPEDVADAYAELGVEPEALPVRRAGAWGRGDTRALLEMSWPHHP